MADDLDKTFASSCEEATDALTDDLAVPVAPETELAEVTPELPQIEAESEPTEPELLQDEAEPESAEPEPTEPEPTEPETPTSSSDAFDAEEGDSGTTSDESSTAPMPTATVKLPATVEAPNRERPQVTVEAPQLRDVGATFVGWLRGRAHAAATFASSHRVMLVAAALACVAVVLGVVLLGIDAAKVPPDELIERDARAKLAAPSYTVGPYATDDPLVLQSIEIERKHPSGSQRDAFEVNVSATFSNTAMETQADGSLTYVREGDEWTCVAATVGKASHRATAGVNQQKALEQIETLLQEADTSNGSEPLSALYHGAAIEVTSDTFDENAQTDVLVLHCASGGTFVSYECDLTAHFRFAAASGAWELSEARVSAGARDLGFGPLIGTWKGTFASQQAASGKCLAARESGLTVNITRAAMTDNGGASIEGTVSGTAHLHAELENDTQASDGDLVLDNAPFTGKLSSGDVEQDVISLLAGNNPKRDTAGIVFSCETPDVVGGEVTLTLEFGKADAPDAASATLTSTFDYQDTFLLIVPYRREARFADTFSLEKVA